MRYVEIDGKRYLWRDILRARREQAKANRQNQPALFDLHDDARPATERTTEQRYREPSLLSILEH